MRRSAHLRQLFCIMELQNVNDIKFYKYTSVSYTHLDVYKRQRRIQRVSEGDQYKKIFFYKFILSKKIRFFFETHFFTSNYCTRITFLTMLRHRTVSYTHLDVYKRQVVRCNRNNKNA